MEFCVRKLRRINGILTKFALRFFMTVQAGCTDLSQKELFVNKFQSINFAYLLNGELII